MTKKGKVLIGVIILVLTTVFLYTNTYTSSPGFTSEGYRKEFLENKPTCYGIDILLNEKATWADAPGRSLCLGYLSK